MQWSNDQIPNIIKKGWPKSDADLCIRCATCMAVCPVSRVTPLFPGPKQAGPGAERFRKEGNSFENEWIDLCIGCHLCDLVCSSNVPISDLTLLAKATYLNEKGRPLRDWFLSRLSHFGSLGSLLSPILNPILNTTPFKWVVEFLLKIDRRREFPPYQFQTFRQWFEKHPTKGGKKIAYFYGCYTNTNEVDVGKATVQVLEANGFEVILPRQKCCGLPMLGNGDLKGARKMALKNIPLLLQAIRSGCDLLFSSTSCGWMIRHEYSHLLNSRGAEEIANHTFDLFEYLRNLKEWGRLNTHFKKLQMKAAYFAPCHLRSLGIGLPALEILRLIPGLQIENIEEDCCGLGGTFGFKKEKFEISQEIGKDLVQAIDRINPEIILTDCEGCRLQIRHLTGLKVLHPVQVLRDSIL